MRRFALALLVSLTGSLAGCDPAEFPGTGGPGPAPGPVCYVDEDCVPADCCGEGSGVVHDSQAPSCFDVQCNTNCDPSQVSCGCGVPYCRDGRCVAAVTACGE